jgi:hypothetical protein
MRKYKVGWVHCHFTHHRSFLISDALQKTWTQEEAGAEVDGSEQGHNKAVCSDSLEGCH